MRLSELARNWEALGTTDPLWAILSTEEFKGSKWKLDEFLQTGTKEIDEVLRYLLQLEIEPGGKALDFGCGVGRLSQALAEHFDEVVGVDIAESMVSRANEINRHGAKVQYRVNKRDDLSIFDDNSFDFIYSRIVLQHMRPALALRYIREFVRVLRPRGCLVFQVTSAPARPLGLRDRLRHLAPKPLLRISRRLRGIKSPEQQGPVIEVHSLAITRVVRELYRRARIVDIRAEHSVGADWISFLYCVTKPPP